MRRNVAANAALREKGFGSASKSVTVRARDGAVPALGPAGDGSASTQTLTARLFLRECAALVGAIARGAALKTVAATSIRASSKLLCIHPSIVQRECAIRMA